MIKNFSISFILIIFLLDINFTFAQLHPRFGIKFGATLSNPSTETKSASIRVDDKSKVSFNVGLSADLIQVEKFLISSELYFNRKTAKGKTKFLDNSGNTYYSFDLEYRIDYLVYDITGRLNFSKSNVIPYIYGSPRINFYLSDKLLFTNLSQPEEYQNIISEKMTRVGFGLSAGAGLEVILSNNISLLGEIQFSPDFFYVYDYEGIKVKSNSLELRVGSKF